MKAIRMHRTGDASVLTLVHEDESGRVYAIKSR